MREGIFLPPKDLYNYESFHFGCEYMLYICRKLGFDLKAVMKMTPLITLNHMSKLTFVLNDLICMKVLFDVFFFLHWYLTLF